ncbi:CPBP family intramembrane glutamic endopeptidase [Tabrizicola sp.]|uniref:CPBP family intramembrane glutamic endopeptidase n=1 Tax=Tabrizicola sp. TaxID=2005166 RepID=UPI0025D5B2B4|nr:CPBP family intramembrane glutamic endopeptidase [Tabrizicola sp.]
MNKRLGIALVALVIWLGITVFAGKLFTDGDISLQEAVSRGIGWAWVAAAGFILAVCHWQGWSDVGLNRWASFRDWRLAWLPMLYILVALGFAFVFGLPPATVLIFIAINCFFVGFSEELMLRGAVFQGFRHTVSIWPAVLLTSVVFGAMHSLNVFVTGDLKQALIQSSAAFLSGILFIALRLRTGSLWVPIIVHALWDFATFTVGGATGGMHHGDLPAETLTMAEPGTLTQFVPVLLVLPNAIYGLWLMRNISATHANPET